MALHLLLLLGVAILAYVGKVLLTFYRNLQACRTSGIPYVVVPFQSHGAIAQIFYPIWHPVLSHLPSFMKGTWLTFMSKNVPWDQLYAPFRQVGSDTVLTCSPTNILLFTAAADVICQIIDRKTDFPKPTYMYGIVDIYGTSVISVEGQIWRKHRKVTAPPFTEKNNRLVWTESVIQAQQMLGHVLHEDKNSSATLEQVEHLISRMALAVISRAGYGVGIGWPSGDEKNTQLADDEPARAMGALDNDWVEGKTNGHTMSYSNAILSVSTDILWLLIFHKDILKSIPISSARRAYQAYINWGQYMREMVAEKQKEINSEAGVKQYGTDLLTSIVRSSRDAHTFVDDQSTKNGRIGTKGLSDDELLGNAFVLIVAGHETTAGVLHIGLVLLAMHVDSQRRLQHDIDSIFLGTPPSEWDYERDFPRLFSGMAGAVFSELLRWLPSVPSVPKWAPIKQTLKVNGATCVVPQGTVMALNLPAAHRNPNQWPYGRPSRPLELEHEPSNPDNDLGEFKPERWLFSLQDSANNNSNIDKTPEASGDAVDFNNLSTKPAADTSPNLLRPPRGAYLPFSEGSRACLGRRFAQVEVMAVLAVVFQKYSVELAVDEWASDEQVAAMSEEQTKVLWTKARVAAKDKFRNCMQSLLTNKMAKGHVPIRIVRRGEERFRAEEW